MSSLNCEKGTGNGSMTLGKVCVPKASLLVLFQYAKLPRIRVNLIFNHFYNICKPTKFHILLPSPKELKLRGMMTT
jgi:hypothetical protein